MINFLLLIFSIRLYFWLDKILFTRVRMEVVNVYQYFFIAIKRNYYRGSVGTRIFIIFFFFCQTHTLQQRRFGINNHVFTPKRNILTFSLARRYTSPIGLRYRKIKREKKFISFTIARCLVIWSFLFCTKKSFIIIINNFY